MTKPDETSTGSTALAAPHSAKPSALTVIALTLMWVLLWGDLSWGNVLAGIALALFVTMLMPMPHVRGRGFAFRPIAVARLVGVFIWDVIVASLQISWTILSGRRPKEAIIRVTTCAHSDAFLTATAALTALVPGSIVIDAHRLTGAMYVHIFDVPTPEALVAAHDTVLRQEERLLRAFATDELLIEAGYVPGGSMKLGRLPEVPKERP